MQKVLLFILIIFSACYQSQANDDISLQIFRLIYNQQYDSAHIVLQENKNHLDRFYSTVVEIDLSYWEHVTGTNNPDYTAFENTLDKYDLKEPITQEEKIISLIVLSYQLRYDFKRYHFVSALQTRKHTMILYNELKNSETALNQSQVEVFRLYHALIQYFNHYPKKYFSDNSRTEMQTAIREMEPLTKSSFEMVKTLSSYFLGKIFLQYEKEPGKSIELFSYLIKEYPLNQKFPEYLEECEVKANN